MSSSDWDEIKRLAADFQRAQLTSSLQRLSERNCVEIINKLVEQKSLEIYFTSSGKEYITPIQLNKEIKDELFVHQGRIDLAELSTILDVNLNIVEKRAQFVAAHDPQIHVVLGELIHEDYLNILAEEVNERLQQNGSVTIAELTKSYDLPGDFLLRVVCRRLGKTICGKQDETDPQTIFTEAFVARHKFQIRGVLTATTQPTQVSNIISRYHFQEQLFFSITEKFIAAGEVKGSISGSRTATQAVYIPSIYSEAQFNWVNNFLKQNGYLEFESLNRLGISDAESYIQRNFGNQILTFVPGACVGQFFIDQIDANLDDALSNGEYVDLLPFLPSIFSGSVCTDLINLALRNREATAKATGCSTFSSICHVFCESIVVSEWLLTKISVNLEQLMPSKAQEAILKGAFKHRISSVRGKVDDSSSKNKKEERRKKAAGGKAGGGTQGRETKTKSTKNKYKGKKGAHHSEDEEVEYDNTQKGQKSFEIEFLSLEEVQMEIAKEPTLEDCPDELLEELANHLYEPITRKFQDVAKNTFLATLSGGGDIRKKTHSHLQEKVTALWSTVRLAEKGMKEFEGEMQGQLCKYLLRTHCTEIVNEIVLYLASDSQIELKSDKELSPEIRLKIISQFLDDMKQPLVAIHKSLAGVSVEQFLNIIDEAMATVGITIKKKDNKKDRQVLLNHRSGLVDQLKLSLTPAISLHLSCLILFQAVTGNLLHASGKFVPQILSFLKPRIPLELFDVLYEYQGLVIRSLTAKDDLDTSSINARLEELTPKIKELTVTFKKPQKERGSSMSED